MTKSLLNKPKKKVFFELEDSLDTTNKVEPSNAMNGPAHTTPESRVDSDGSRNNIVPQDGDLLKLQHKQKENESIIAPTKKTQVVSSPKQLHGKAPKTDQGSINNNTIIPSVSSVQSKENMDVASGLETIHEASISTHEENEQNSESNAPSQAIQTSSARRENDCSLG